MYMWAKIVLLFYTTYISVDLAQHEIFRVKVGKGGINNKYINRGFFLVSSKIFRQEMVCGSGKTPSKSKSKDKFYSNILI